jgi:integrase
MNVVQPIRDIKQINAMKRELLKTGHRNYLIFCLGINSGLRIGDIIKLKVVDVRDKTHVTIKEEKTGKYKRFRLTNSLIEELGKYIEVMDDDGYLFKSQKGVNNPISRIQIYRILNETGKKIGITEIGTHTLRKTFGYHFYKMYKDVAILQELFNHCSPSVTLVYIGINQDVLDTAMEAFEL